MSLRHRITLRGPVLGFIDGIMNALALTAGSILRSDRPVTGELAVQISLFAATTGLFVIFVSGYVDLRAALVRAARQLNLTESGRLAATRLGRTIVREAGWEATDASGGPAAVVPGGELKGRWKTVQGNLEWRFIDVPWIGGSGWKASTHSPRRAQVSRFRTLVRSRPPTHPIPTTRRIS